MIEIRGLSKEFQTFRRLPGFAGTVRSFFKREWITKHALQEINATLSPGELVGLLGANGAGKTTLVKILSGIVHPTTGEARVLGEIPWKRSRDFRSSISLVMGQKAQLWWDLTPADSFELLREIYRIPHATYRRNLNSLREWLSVGDQIHTPVRRLSLGERMKMELIAALLHDPKVIFLDEPTIGLDVNAQSAMREFLALYRREKKPIILLTSHYMKDIEALCERIILIHGGRFVYDGSLKEALKRLNGSRTLTLELEAPLTPEQLKKFETTHRGVTANLLNPLRLETEKALTYRFDFLVRILGKALSVSLISWFLWSSVYSGLGVETLNGLSLNEIRLYYICIPLTLLLVMGSDFDSVSTEIYDGSLSRFLLYPRNFLLIAALRRSAASWIAAIPYLLLWVFSPIPGKLFFFFIAWSILAAPLLFTLLTTIDLLAFWFDQTWSLRSMMRLVILFSAGGFVPVSLFPETLKPLAHWLPFYSMIGFQSEALAKGTLPNSAEILRAGSQLLLWGLLFLSLLGWTWKRGLRSFTGSGM